MSRRDDVSLLRDMIEACRQALAAVEHRTRGDLDGDLVWAWGLTKCLEIIGEAASQLSDGIRTRGPAVPWPRIIGMRNRLVHAYFEVDYDQVWRTIAEDLPPLIHEIERLLRAYPNNSPEQLNAIQASDR